MCYTKHRSWAGLLVAVIIPAVLLMQAVPALAEQSAKITEQEAQLKDAVNHEK